MLKAVMPWEKGMKKEQAALRERKLQGLSALGKMNSKGPVGTGRKEFGAPVGPGRN